MTLKTTRSRTKNATFLAVVVFFKAMIFQNSSKRDQIGLLAIFVRKLEKTKIKKKRPRMAHFWKTRYKVDNLKSLYLKSSTWRSKVAAVSTFSCRRFRRFSRRHPPKRVCVGVGKMRPEESDVKENPSQSVSQSVSQRGSFARPFRQTLSLPHLAAAEADDAAAKTEELIYVA